MLTVTKIGEAQVKMTENVNSTEDLNVLLRIGWGAETTGRLSFKPADNLRVGDELCLTLDKLVEVKDEPKPIESAAPQAEAIAGTIDEAVVSESCACATETAATETAPVETAACEPAPAPVAEPEAAAVEEKPEEPPVDKIGEVSTKIVIGCTQENNPRFLLRIIYKNKSTEAPITLAEDLKTGDKIKITLIRTQKAPEPEAETAGA